MPDPVRFSPLVNFINVDSRNVVHSYEAGLQYTVHNNSDHNELAASVAKWLEEGKVEIISKDQHESARRVQVSGAGVVA